MTTRGQLARAVRVARAQRRLTQDGLARASGVSRTTIASIEGEVYDTRLETVAIIARACGLGVGQLLELGEPSAVPAVVE